MPKEADVILVNNLEASGFLNGIINLAFSTSRFIPEVRETDELGKFETVVGMAPMITINMRMDLWLAQQVRDRLDELIAATTKPAGPVN
jgi:hypothetical protein